MLSTTAKINQNASDKQLYKILTPTLLYRCALYVLFLLSTYAFSPAKSHQGMGPNVGDPRSPMAELTRDPHPHLTLRHW